MSHHTDPRPDGSDEAFTRLRAADPAAGLTPHAADLDAAVRSRVGDVLPAGTVPSGRPDVDEVAAARARRAPRRWLAVAAVAAGTLVVGSAGYALGDRSDGDLVASSPTGAVALPGAGAGGPEAAVGQAGPEVGARVAEESVAADSMGWYGGRTVFVGRGLSETGGTADAWGFDPGQVFDAGTAARVATALGLAGEPTLQGGTWTVGALDGTGPNLQLQPDGVASVSFYDPTRDPFGCPVPEPEGPVEDDARPAGPDAPTCEPSDLGVAPQGDAAVARAREVLAGTGVDPDGFEYEVMDAGTEQAVYVTAHALLGGERTGMTWSLTLAGDGVQSLYGSLAPLVPLGAYEVISPAAAVARLSDPRFGSGGGPIMYAGEEEVGGAGLVVGPDEPVASDDGQAGPPPAPVAAGARFSWPVTEVVLTGARLGLAQHTHPDGATVLVPAYELTDDRGAVWSVVAVTDDALDFSAPAAP